jgi:heat shock protein HslJ
VKFKVFIILGLVVSMLLSSCSKNNPISLDGSAWILTELNGQPVLSEPLVTLSFNAGKLGGTDGCNHYGGSYTVKGSQFSAGKELFSTLMACEEGIMQQASAYLSALTSAVQYEINGEKLSLLDENGAALGVFNAQSQDLAGTSWIVTGFNNGHQGVVSPILDTELTLVFDTAGKLSGRVCNSYFGAYETGKGTIQISELGQTEMYCVEPEGIMEQEAQFLQALGTAATYRVDGNRLEMRTARDEIAVSLTKAP